MLLWAGTIYQTWNIPQLPADNPWIGHLSQTLFSVLLPLEDWFCKKLENLNLVLIEGYPSKSTEPGGLHMDQFLHPPESQSCGEKGAYHNLLADLYDFDVPGFTNVMRMTPEFF